MELGFFLSDWTLLFISIGGLLITGLLGYYVAGFKSDEDRIGGNADDEHVVAEQKLRRKKSEAEKKEERKKARQLSKDLLRDLKESCKQSQLANRRPDKDLPTVCIDERIDVEALAIFLSDHKVWSLV